MFPQLEKKTMRACNDFFNYLKIQSSHYWSLHQTVLPSYLFIYTLYYTTQTSTSMDSFLFQFTFANNNSFGFCLLGSNTSALSWLLYVNLSFTIISHNVNTLISIYSWGKTIQQIAKVHKTLIWFAVNSQTPQSSVFVCVCVSWSTRMNNVKSFPHDNLSNYLKVMQQ